MSGSWCVRLVGSDGNLGGRMKSMIGVGVVIAAIAAEYAWSGYPVRRSLGTATADQLAAASVSPAGALEGLQRRAKPIAFT